MRRLVFLSVVLVCVTLAGCDGKDPDLVLYCAAGIRPPAVDLVKAFEEKYGVTVSTDYAGSEVLLSKIKISQRGDLYMPGDSYYIEQAKEAGMILSSRPVCYWVPTILVRKGNPKGVGGLDDLTKPGLKVGLGDPDVCAIGRTTWKILAKNGITREDMKENLVFQSLTVNELGMQIQTKALDAVIIWDAMAKYYGEYGDEVAIESGNNVISSVNVGVLKFTKNQDLAEKFTVFLASEEGRAIFEKHSYRTERPE